MNLQKCLRAWAVALIAIPCVVGLSDVASADVDLVWSPVSQTVSVGQTVLVDLYAVSTGPVYTTAAIDVIINWDTTYLSGITKNGMEPQWIMDGFFTPQVDGLNADLTDGSVLYNGWVTPGGTCYITTSGLKLATFSFVALAPTPATLITIPPTAGIYTKTVVYDGIEPNTPIPSSRGTASITIVPEPSTFIALLSGIGMLAGLRRRRL